MGCGISDKSDKSVETPTPIKEIDLIGRIRNNIEPKEANKIEIPFLKSIVN